MSGIDTRSRRSRRERDAGGAISAYRAACELHCTAVCVCGCARLWVETLTGDKLNIASVRNCSTWYIFMNRITATTASCGRDACVGGRDPGTVA